MDEHYHSMIRLLQSAGIGEEIIGELCQHTNVVRVPAGASLVEAGEAVHKAYFSTVGLFRLYYLLEDGKEYTKGFVLERQFFTSYAAMVQGLPSPFSIEALEDSVVIEIPYPLILKLMDRDHRWERFVRLAVEQLYFKKEERERQLLYLDAKSRYESFKQRYPGLDQRIAQYHIASYLGINPVSLSRLLRTRSH